MRFKVACCTKSDTMCFFNSFCIFFCSIETSFSQTPPQATRNSNGSCLSRSYHPGRIHQYPSSKKNIRPLNLAILKATLLVSSIIFPIVTWKEQGMVFLSFMHNSSLVNIPSTRCFEWKPRTKEILRPLWLWAHARWEANASNWKDLRGGNWVRRPNHRSWVYTYYIVW